MARRKKRQHRIRKLPKGAYRLPKGSYAVSRNGITAIHRDPPDIEKLAKAFVALTAELNQAGSHET